ncbi:MAG: hypothetical protein AB7P31_05020 [Steroidobacteraceae bacterium]
MLPRRALLPLLACAFAALALAPSRATAQSSAAGERVTVDIELEHCAKTLRRVARLFSSGFTRGEADRLAREIEALPTDRAGQWTFQVSFEGGAASLTVHALVDELSMVDLDFVATPAIAGRIRKALADIDR